MGATKRRSIVTLATAYEDQSGSGDELVIPEDLTTLSAEELSALSTQATEAFDAIYGEGTDLDDEALASLASLTEGIEALTAEAARREQATTERAEAAAALAARVRGEDAPADGEDTPADGEDAPAEDEGEDTPADEDAPAEDEALVAAAPRGEVRVSMVNVASRRSAAARTEANADSDDAGIRQYMVASGEGMGVGLGAGVDFGQVGEMLDSKLARHNAGAYISAARTGRAMREQSPIVSIRRPVEEGLVIEAGMSGQAIKDVLDRAADESRLPGGSLVASGTGWCAPSTTIYDFAAEDESREGLLDIPEVAVTRGGLSFTRGPDFADLFARLQAGEIGFSFTEEQDVAGEYQPGEDGGPNVVGPKPCFKVECPPFEDYRLDVDGLCIQSGLLQQRGFPEVLARTTRGVLVAHEHYLNGKQIAQIAAGSTAVTLPATQVGTAAPVLSAIELQVEHYRYSRRLGRGVTLEAVFPFWVRGAIRSDLSRRLGVDLLSVPNARIDEWFRERGVAPQFVYNWQAIDTTAAAAFNAWPTTVSFLLYSAGTWIKGVQDVITLDTIYDSTLLSTNDFTALFTEDGWFVAKRGHDSRVITTSISADGAAHIGVEIEHNGTLAA